MSEIKNLEVPIIFCHYGESPYLRYVLNCAKESNPDKKVILLGDKLNKSIAQECGIEFWSFSDFDHGDKVKTFDRVYRLIQGKEHGHFKGGRDWVNFVFKRWFFVFNFIKQENISSFWHFDSDNMLLDQLSKHEWKFSGYDCTEQCQGICMNGFISGPEVVSGYLDKINEIFQREEYLNSVQDDFNRVHPKFAFTEMKAYEIYKTEEHLHVIRLNSIIDDSTFDDSLILEDGMDMEPLPYKKDIKKVYLCPDGRFFCREKSMFRLIRMNSLNLSYVPVYIFEEVLSHQRAFAKSKTKIEPDVKSMKTLGRLPVPIKVIVRTKVKKMAQGLGLIPKWA